MRLWSNIGQNWYRICWESSQRPRTLRAPGIRELTVGAKLEVVSVSWHYEAGPVPWHEKRVYECPSCWQHKRVLLRINGELAEIFVVIVGGLAELLRSLGRQCVRLHGHVMRSCLGLGNNPVSYTTTHSRDTISVCQQRQEIPSSTHRAKCFFFRG